MVVELPIVLVPNKKHLTCMHSSLITCMVTSVQVPLTTLQLRTLPYKHCKVPKVWHLYIEKNTCIH